MREGKGHSLPRVAPTALEPPGSKVYIQEDSFDSPVSTYEAGYWLFKITLSSDRSNPLTPIEQEMKLKSHLWVKSQRNELFSLFDAEITFL